MISRQMKYALWALIELAHQPAGKAVQTMEIARVRRIPKKFLEQILLTLKRGGLVRSQRGSLGGYLLARPAGDITVTQVMRLIDGPMAPLPCLSVVAYSRCADCPDEDTCAIRHAFAPVAEANRRILDGVTLASLADDTSASPLMAAQ